MFNRIACTFFAFAALFIVARAETPAVHPFEKEIAAYEAADKTTPPPQGAIVFTGASGIRFWKTLAQDFPGLTVLNRGFGGSQLSDSIRFAERIVIPYHPKAVVIQAGGNDINAGKTPEQVLADFQAWVTKVRAALPDVRLIYLGQGPSPARWAQREKQQQANQLVRDYIAQERICSSWTSGRRASEPMASRAPSFTLPTSCIPAPSSIRSAPSSSGPRWNNKSCHRATRDGCSFDIPARACRSMMKKPPRSPRF